MLEDRTFAYYLIELTIGLYMKYGMNDIEGIYVFFSGLCFAGQIRI